MKKHVGIFLLQLFFSSSLILAATGPFIDSGTASKISGELVQRHGEKNRFRIERGVEQVARFWQQEDGGKEEFETFCRENFIDDELMLEKVFQRIELFNEAVSGHFTEMSRDILRPLDLDWGEILPIDMLMGQFNPAAHLNEDLFQNRIAFVILLNFPHYTLEEKSELGQHWSRKEWAYASIGDQFISRVPARIFQQISEKMTRAETYISEYNIHMGNIVDEKGKRYFPKDLTLISHWGIRDELKARYADPDGLKKQEIIYQIMLRIISQEIPEDMVNKGTHTWDPVTNKLYKDDREVSFKREPDTRYQTFLETFKAMRLLDPYFPDFPTHVKRKFELDRKIPYQEVESMFTEVCSSRQIRETAQVVRARLGRPLRPFDIWFTGFSGNKKISEEELDRIVSRKYPTPESFEKELPDVLVKLGFSPEQSRSIAVRIQVDPARGAGHSAGAELRTAKARLRTRVPKTGMDYKGFNIAMHELGHSAEQTMTLHNMDYYVLRGVPNTAFTEGFAFVFQGRNLEMLGLKDEERDAASLKTLDTLWMSYEIMGVALVDMRAWDWLYKHPDADEARLKEAVISISKDVWNRYYADVFGIKDQPILAIYSHMIDYALYLPDYPLGHVIQYQMQKYLEGKNLGSEMERMCKSGSIIPQLWMQNAVGSKISVKPLLDAADEALMKIKD